jgi:hypothetical protein
MSKADEERAKRLAQALRQNLRRRKAQARGEEILLGTVEGASSEAENHLHDAAHGPPPPAGEDL